MPRGSTRDSTGASEHETRHSAAHAIDGPLPWYAAYMNARQGGRTEDEASAAAGLYMAEVKHVIVPDA